MNGEKMLEEKVSLYIILTLACLNCLSVRISVA